MQLLSELNWSLIGTLLVVSAFVAWIGDIIGLKLGKKRVTIFNIRPKYTSRIISVITGVGIALVTLFASALASESVRTAIFNMKYVKNQISVLTAELKTNRENLSSMEYQLFQSQGELREKQDKLTIVESQLTSGTKKLDDANRKLEELEKARDKAAREQKQLSSEVTVLRKNVSELNDEADGLKSGIQHLREDRIAVFSGEILAQAVVTSAEKLKDENINDALMRLSEACQTLLGNRFGINPDNIPAPNISESSVNAVKNKLKSSSGRYLIRLTALANAVAGETIDAEISVFSTKHIYKKGARLAEVSFDGTETRGEIETKIYNTLRSVNQKAVKDGVLRDPISGTVGSVDANELSQAVQRIAREKIPCVLRLLASREIYSEGPVTLTLELKQ